MSDIRVTYSGLIAFVAGIAGMFLGLIFSLIITRSLTPEEFGTWGLILSIVNYLLISDVIFSYWSLRQIARNEPIGKTSVLSTSLLSMGILPIFAIYTFFISESTETQYEILLLGLVLIPVSFIGQTLTSINRGYKPHVVSYSQIIFQVVKIPIVLILVIGFNFDILGVVMAVLIAFIAKIFVLSYFAKDKIKEKFNYQKLKWWVKYSWIPLFNNIPNFLTTVDVAIYSMITGSVIGIAYYQAALTIGHIVSNSGVISQALYPKLLSDKSFEGITKNLDHTLYFGILLLGLSIIFSKPALFALNPLYQNAWPVVIVISFKIFLQSLRTIPAYIVFGTEQIDTEKNPQFSKLIKSNLFKMPKYIGIFNMCYILGLIIFLHYFSNSFSEMELVFWWAFMGLIIEIPMSFFMWTYSRKYAKFSFPKKSFLKHISGIIALVIFFLLTSDFILNYEPSIYDFLPSLLLELAICIMIYVGITFLINQQTRKLFKSIIREIKKF